MFFMILLKNVFSYWFFCVDRSSRLQKLSQQLSTTTTKFSYNTMSFTGCSLHGDKDDQAFRDAYFFPKNF